MRIPDRLKVFVFYLLKWLYRLSSRFEPARRRILIPLKRANAYVAVRDCRHNRYRVRNYPSYVTIQTTWRCNLTCPMCFRQHWPEGVVEQMNQQVMSFEDFRAVADEILPFAFTVNLSVAGEPLLAPDLDKVLNIISRHQCKLEIFTNLTPLTSDALMARIMPHVGILRASVDGATKETFEKIRRGAQFEKCIQALERFGRLRVQLEDPKPGFGLWVVVQRDNVRELPELIRLAKRLRADSVGGDHIIVLDDSMRELSVEHEAVYRESYEEASRVAKELGVSIQDLRPPSQMAKGLRSPQNEGSKSKSWLECPFLWSRVVVDYDGKVLACCHPRPPEFSGNALKDGFWRVWDGDIARRIRKYYLSEKAHPSCKDCYLLVEVDEQTILAGRRMIGDSGAA